MYLVSFGMGAAFPECDRTFAGVYDGTWKCPGMYVRVHYSMESDSGQPTAQPDVFPNAVKGLRAFLTIASGC